MARLGSASSYGVIGMDDADSLSGADTVFGFNGTDHISTSAPRGAANDDPFLDDTHGQFDAALGYTIAYQSLMAQAWKNEPSLILQHLDWGGSCALGETGDQASPGGSEAVDGLTLAAAIDLLIADAPPADEPPPEDGDINDADFAVAGTDLFGMT